MITDLAKGIQGSQREPVLLDSPFPGNYTGSFMADGTLLLSLGRAIVVLREDPMIAAWRCWQAVVLATVWGGITLFGPAARAVDWIPLIHEHASVQGAWSCAATACHGGDNKTSYDQVGGEIELWRNADPHSLGLSLIESDAPAPDRPVSFAQMLQRLGIIRPGKIPPSRGPGSRQVVLDGNSLNAQQIEATRLATARRRLSECMNCHNPSGVATSWTEEVVDTSSVPSDGFAIACESCHGPAKHWIGDHYRRGFDRYRESFTGFHDLKDLVVRGRVCAQCHIGDEHRDMNHDMIAAGHPPLRFDLASYDRRYEGISGVTNKRRYRKHWSDARHRTQLEDYELRLWLAGQIANADSGLALTRSRLERSSIDYKPNSRASAVWPEFAEFTCTGCHEKLGSPLTWDAKSLTTALPSAHPLRWEGWTHGQIDRLFALSETGNRWLARLQEVRPKLESLGDEPEEIRKLISELDQLRYTGRSPEVSFRSAAVSIFPELFQLRPQAASLRMRLGDLGLAQGSTFSTWDDAASAYAYLIAYTKSELDERARRGQNASVPPVLGAELAKIKRQLAASYFITRVDEETDVNAAIARAAQMLSEGR